ncbi:MAG: AAA family ATPase [Mycobacteriales bacterium]
MSNTHTVTQSLSASIASQLIGRDREAVIVTLALIAREHVLMVGPPGTAKSLLCRVTAGTIIDARYCERLLSPTTAPEAIWGPVSIAALRQDRYEHVTAGYAADAHVLYLDEVGRASPAILDTLLHLLGPERQALIGTQQIKTPLVAAIGSANTWPEDAAMLDRWTLRASVQYLGAGLRRQLLTFAPPVPKAVASLADLAAAHNTSLTLSWSPAAFTTLDEILNDLDEAGIAVSDRRLRAGDRVARAAAVLRGGTSVEPGDLEALQWVLWTVPDQAATAAQKVVARANPIGAKLDQLLSETDELVRSITDAATRLDAVQKIDAILKEAKGIANQPGANGRAAKVVKYVHGAHVRLQGQIMGLPADKIELMLAAAS